MASSTSLQNIDLLLSGFVCVEDYRAIAPGIKINKIQLKAAIKHVIENQRSGIGVHAFSKAQLFREFQAFLDWFENPDSLKIARILPGYFFTEVCRQFFQTASLTPYKKPKSDDRINMVLMHSDAWKGATREEVEARIGVVDVARGYFELDFIGFEQCLFAKLEETHLTSSHSLLSHEFYCELDNRLREGPILELLLMMIRDYLGGLWWHNEGA
ncbi:MAG: hypothetical protein M1814_003913 [Vezdaea aestivalis]|nr:MAG: hypothetical protein M1814_003913 [Vezdaea aestivalis]